MQNTPSAYVTYVQSFFVQVYRGMTTASYTASSEFLLSLIFGSKLIFYEPILASMWSQPLSV